MTAEPTGQEGYNEELEAYYVAYEFKDGEARIDLDSFEKMYQIKPNGETIELQAVAGDPYLWFKTTGQIPGTHVFLVKQDGVWYRAEIEWGAVKASFAATENIGAHDGKVYEEYQLVADGKVIDLSAGKVKSITVLEPNAAEPKTLEPNTDSTLWFNVENEGGNYVFTVVDNNDITYTATLSWAGPTTVTAKTTGQEGYNEELQAYYVEYEFLKADNSRLDLSSFTKMYQIKPAVEGQTSEVVALTANTDETLWFKTTGQIPGTHVFLVKQDGIWYRAEIEWMAPVPEVTFTFSGLDNVTAGTVAFSITTKVTNNGAIADDTPLRYKAVVTKDNEPLAGQTIKYPELGDNWPTEFHTFTTDDQGVAYFGPATGFTLAQLPALLTAEGVTTPFQADLEAGNYSVTVSLVDITGGSEQVLGEPGIKEFTVA
ncbi:MAG TPA: hypothetical protein GXX50_11285 [Firmicutes bacterium]|nr:hypothetical protein [Bacillota bacterium]